MLTIILVLNISILQHIILPNLAVASIVAQVTYTNTNL